MGSSPRPASRVRARARTRKTRAQNPWNVPTYAPSVARAASASPNSSNRSRMRSRNSSAARSVNVIARIRSGAIPSSHTARANRSTSTEVLPLPAPAATSSGSPRPADGLLLFGRQRPRAHTRRVRSRIGLGRDRLTGGGQPEVGQVPSRQPLHPITVHVCI